MKCKSCGYEFGPKFSAKFCSECGTSVSFDTDKIKCRECGFEVDNNLKFCPECGESMTNSDYDKRKGRNRGEGEDDDNNEGGILGGIGDLVGKILGG